MKVGVLVTGRAAVSLTQPDAVAVLAINLRYPAVPVCTTCAIARIGLSLRSCTAMAASISRGTA